MIKKIHIFIFLLSCISAVQFTATAQKATVKATVEPVDILIGQQSTISLEVIAPKGRQITFPVYADTLVSGIEVIGMPKADTVYAHDVMTITQHYVVTSFDSALYHVPFMPVLDGADTIMSNGIGLKVSSPMLSEATTAYLEHLNANPTDSLDIDKLAVYDIKAIQEPPFVWQDYLMYILIGLLILIAIAAIIVAIYMYKKKKQKGYFFKPVVVQPPHVIALTALNQVKEEKLWQQGREKEYYTEITDILRRYIEDRFHIYAMEMTSDEILRMIKNYVETGSSVESLTQILKTADLVKFAKYRPFPDENDLSLVNSFLFVNQTKREEPVDQPQDPNTPVHPPQSPTMPQDNRDEPDRNEHDIDWTVSEDDVLPEHRDDLKKGDDGIYDNDKYNKKYKL